MANQEIVIKEALKSQQCDIKTGELLIDLRIGDIVIIEENVIYFKRKIPITQDGAEYTKKDFEEFKKRMFGL